MSPLAQLAKETYHQQWDERNDEEAWEAVVKTCVKALQRARDKMSADAPDPLLARLEDMAQKAKAIEVRYKPSDEEWKCARYEGDALRCVLRLLHEDIGMLPSPESLTPENQVIYWKERHDLIVGELEPEALRIRFVEHLEAMLAAAEEIRTRLLKDGACMSSSPLMAQYDTATANGKALRKVIAMLKEGKP